MKIKAAFLLTIISFIPVIIGQAYSLNQTTVSNGTDVWVQVNSPTQQTLHSTGIGSDSQMTGEWGRAYLDNSNFDALGSGAIIQPTSDGGYVVASSTVPVSTPSSGNISVLKLYPDGGIAWRYEYGTNMSDRITTIQEIPDGGYILLGATESETRMWLLNLDATGSILWQKTYAYHTYNRALSLHLTNEGNYIVTGETYNYLGADWDAWVLKLSNDGSIVWQKLYGGALRDSLSQIQSTGDGGYLVIGSTESFAPGAEYNPALWILKLTAEGEISWQKTYGDDTVRHFQIMPGEIGGNDVSVQSKPLAGGGYIILRGNQLLAIDNNGTVIWGKQYPEANIASLAENSDGTFLLVGWLPGIEYMSDDIWVAKINGAGEIIWQKNIGESISRAYWASSGQSVGDNYVVTGSRSYGPGDYELLVFKLNELGEIPDCNLCGVAGVIIQTVSLMTMDSGAAGIDTNSMPENSSVTRQSVSTQAVTLCGEEPVPPLEIPPANIVLAGPAIGQLGVSYDFTAEVNPVTTTLPLNYVWQATQQSPINRTGGLSDTVSYLWDTPGIQSIEVTVSNNVGSVIDKVIMIIGDVLAIVEPGAESSIASGQVLINIPANAVSESTELLYTAVTPSSTPPDSIFLGFAFTLDAYRDGVHQEGFVFDRPVTVTVQYDPMDTTRIDENALKLYFWDEDVVQWLDAAATCTPNSVYDRQPGQLSVTICHLSEFGFFGSEQYRIYLPQIQR